MLESGRNGDKNRTLVSGKTCSKSTYNIPYDNKLHFNKGRSTYFLGSKERKNIPEKSFTKFARLSQLLHILFDLSENVVVPCIGLLTPFFWRVYSSQQK